MKGLMRAAAAGVALFGATALGAVDQSASATWGVVSPQVERNQPFEAWLVIPESSPSLSIKLVEVRGLRLWWAPDATPCGDPPKPRPVLLNGTPSGAARVCGVTTTLETPFRLVAVIEHAQSSRTQLLMSSAIEIKPSWELPRWLVTMLSVIGGVIVGVLTPSIQTAFDKWTALKQSRIGLLTYAARDVRPMLRTLREELSPYCHQPGSIKMERVSDSVSLNIRAPSSPVYRLLPDTERTAYLKPFIVLQNRLNAFNGAVGQDRKADAIKIANQILPLIDELLGIAESETSEERASKRGEETE